MTRRRGDDVFDAAVEATRLRWRYAVRHPEFRAELERLGDLLFEKAPSFEDEFLQVRLAWGFPMVPLRALTGFRDVPADEIVSPFLDAMDASVMTLPVVALERVEGGSPWILMMVDTTFPLDMLVSAFETEARDLVGKGGSRRRYDKARFYLDVYDRAEKAQSFDNIARALNRPLSTVKSAYIAASRNIFGVAGAPSKAKVPLVGFDHKKHMGSCSTCKKAQTFNDMCAAARTYARQG